MKKIALILTFALGMSLLAGCGGSSAPATTAAATTLAETTAAETTAAETTAAETTAEEEETPAAGVLGGWEILDAASVLSEDEAAVFEKAVTEWTGSGFEPVAVIATQVVAGTNYCYLAKMTSVTVSPKSRYVFVYVYADLEGNAKISGIKDIEINMDDSEETGESTEGLMGGWTIADLEGITVENQEDFEKAFEGFVGSDISPVACLASQLVAGTNYCFLVKETRVTAEPVSYIALAYVYKDLEGNVQLTNIHTINYMP